jgi:RNA polymerase sigma-32 factor
MFPLTSFSPRLCVGSIDHYVNAINKLPLLDLEAEQVLGQRVRDSNDIDAAKSLILSHLRLVVAISRGYIGYGIPQGDLIQEGNVGLMMAVKRFDPSQGARLSTFATYSIRAQIHEYTLRNWRLVKVATTKAQRKLFFRLRGMRTGEHALTQVEAKRIANELSVMPEEVFEMNMRLNGRDIAMEGTPDDADSEWTSPVTYLRAEESADPAVVIEADQASRFQHEGLKRAILKLDDRSRDIITQRWLADEESATLQTLADAYDVSAERIRQIEVAAMKQMRAEIEAYRR